MAFISDSALRSFLNEDFYLENNPDVQAAVEREEFASGFDHFLAFGLQEGRIPNESLTFFSPENYLENNPDVQAAVEDGLFEGALDHFLAFGLDENRAGSGFEFFDAASYLDANPDVAAEVNDGDGVLDSALEHYLKFGFAENRGGLFTISNNPDNTLVDAIVDEGDTLTFTVESANGGVVGRDVEVEFSIAGDIDLGDIVGETLSGTALIEAGTSSATFSLELAEDFATEGFEGVTATASVLGDTLENQAVVNDTSTNAPPVAADDEFTTDQDTAITIAAADLLGNDTDPEGDPLAVIATSEVENGTIEEETAFSLGGGSIEHEGTVTFNEEITVGNFTIGFDEARATGDASGFFVADTVDLDTILFDLSNPESLSVDSEELNLLGSDLLVSAEFAEILDDSALAGTDVGDVQTSAILAEESPGNLVVEDGVTSVDLDTDVLEDEAGLTLTGTDSDATAAEGFAVGFDIVETSDFSLLESITSLTFTPDEGFDGVGSFSYTISDSEGGTDTATATINVEAVAPEVIAVTPDQTAIDETDNNVVEFTIETQDADEGDIIDLSFAGDIDADDVEGDLPTTTTISADGTASVSLSFVADETTEGDETFTLSAGIGEQTVTSQTVTVEDTSLDPVVAEVIAVNADPTVVNETDNNVVEFTIETQDAAEGETIDLSFAGDIDGDDVEGDLPTTATVGADGTASVSLTFAADESTDEGDEIFSLSAAIGDQSAIASPDVTVEDTSIAEEPPQSETISVGPDDDGSILDATTGDITFDFAQDNYAVTIDGFGSGDVLDFFGDTVASVSLLGSTQTSGSDGEFSVEAAAAGNIVQVDFTGVDPAADAQITGINSFDSVFGEDSVIA